MRLRQIRRGLVKWACTATALVCFIVGVGHIWWEAGIRCPGGSSLHVASGGLVYFDSFMTSMAGPFQLPDDDLVSKQYTGRPVPLGRYFVPRRYSWAWVPYIDFEKGHLYRLRVPLLVLFVLAAFPAMFLWRSELRERGRQRLGLCPACGYDRRGLASAVLCPECGAAVPPPVPNSLP